MSKILIPRSDSISAKIIEPSDFESFFSSDFINDYVKTGLTLSAGTGLAVNIAAGQARLKGLFINNTATESKGSLTANNTNYIYVTLARDTNSEAESWDFTSNTSGTTPTDSLFIGTATTNGSGVTAVNMDSVLTKSTPSEYFGNGSNGASTISANTTLANTDNVRQYTTLTVDATKTLTCGTGGSTVKHWILFATTKITINGTISLDGKGGVGGAGGGGGAGGAGGPGHPNQSSASGSAGSAGSAGIGGFGYNGVGGAGNAGSSGAGGGTNLSSWGSGGGGGGSGASPAAGTNLGNTDPSDFTSIVLAFQNLSHWGTGGTGGTGGGGGGGGAGTDTYGGTSGATGGTGGPGGPGGNGGGSILLVAPQIIFGANAAITCLGVAGTNGSNGSVGGNSSFGQGGAGGVFGGSAAAPGGNSTHNADGGGGGGGGAGGQGGTGQNGFIGLIGYNVPSQSDLNAKGTAQVKVRLEF
jgi:hypothetical protein